MANAATLSHLLPTIGASIGFPSFSTLVARHQQIHLNTLGAHVNPYDAQARSMIEAMRRSLMAAGADPITATQQAYASIFGMVQRQATMMAFNDAFRVLMILFLLMLPLIRSEEHTSELQSRLH